MDALAPKRTIHSEVERSVLIARFVKHLPNLRAYAMKVCGNSAKADDLVQGTILRAIENIELFDGANEGAWLFTILNNTFRSDYRRLRREVEFDPAVVEKTLTVNVFTREVESGADLNKILMCLALLPVQMRDALIAIGYLGISYEDAALIFGCATGTIKSRTNRARELLARRIEEDQIVRIDLSPLRRATRGVPKNHPYYPIALAYEELFTECDDVVNGAFVGKSAPTSTPVSESEQLWQELIASGALEDEAPSCIQM